MIFSTLDKPLERGKFNCQTPVRLGFDFVLPLSEQEKQEQEQDPSPKSTRRGCARDLKFGN